MLLGSVISGLQTVWKLTLIKLLQARETYLLGKQSLSKKGKEDVNEEDGLPYNPSPPCTAITSELLLAENDASHTST